MSAVIGHAVRRREDDRLVVGRGRFTDDLQLPGMVYASILRSPHAHARIRRIDTSRARAIPGVLAVLTGRDLEGALGPVPTAWIPPDAQLKQTVHRPLAVDVVRYVGDGVAVVVAEDRYLARDARDAIVIDYEPLPAVVDVMAAVREGAPQVHADAPGNIALHWRAGQVPDDAFARAEVVVRQRFVQQRLIPNPLEPRAAVAAYDPATGSLTLWMTSQNPHIHRFLLSGILGIPEHLLRVVAQDVGGGFGSKISCYPDEALVAHAARVVGRPVKWVEDRSEHFTATTHGRDQVQEVELAGTRDGTVTALRVKAWANLGAYLSTAAPGVPTILFGLIVNGGYRIPHAETEVWGVFTHTTPVDAYRGAGRPEATYLIERMMDLYARAIGRDPIEVRRRNFVPADAFPYTNPFGITYDSGDYARALDRALERLGYAELRARQQALRSQGRYLGIGFSTYVEMCGLGPSEVAGAVGFQGGLWEHATVRVHPSGKVQVLTGASPHGQGEETTFAQIVADRLGVALEDIEVVHGDTDQITMGWGTYGSRSLAVGGSAVAVACQRLIDKGRLIAAHMLEASPEDVTFAEGRYTVAGVPDRAVSFTEVALQAHLAWKLPAGVEPGMEASSAYDPKNFTFPFGTHVAVVEVNPKTGAVTLERYLAVDDCGTPINPMIIAGQVHGGVVQGVGQALWEGAEYSPDGQLLTNSFLEYAMPRARAMPDIETDATVTPSPHNPLGVKGVGETGTIAATPAVVNAVMDALAPWGIKHLDMPLTPEKIWRAIQAKEARA